MTDKIKCQRCGKERGYKADTAKVKWAGAAYRNTGSVRICPKCWQSFEAWLNNPKASDYEKALAKLDSEFPGGK